ncbi:MAG TPA: ABC transporter permease subunit [Vicinamibacterales bacterium]|nr:ABC transporter permease subunit [Vicinamibacterales bacterium]
MSIARKEWREIVRDRRSLYSGLFYGVWGPLVMGIALLAMARHQGELGPITIGAQGTAQAPSLVSYLASRGVTVHEVADGPAAVRAHDVPAALIVDDRYAKRFTEGRPAEVALLFNSTRPESSRYASHVRSMLTDYSRAVGDTRLVVRGIAPGAIAPVRIVDRDFATAAERAGRAFATLPIFVLLAAFVGGMAVAADAGAGERERGSLESLLLHPVSRGSIVVGKWMAVSASALATVALALVVSYAVLRHPRLQQLDLPIALTVNGVFAMAAILLPLVLAAAAVQLLMAFQSRTFKEAQTKLSMLIFVPMIPGFLFAFGTLDPAPWMALAPMIGQHMLVTSLVRGEPIVTANAVAVSVVTVAAAAAAITAAARLLDRETVLRRAGV